MNPELQHKRNLNILIFRRNRGFKFPGYGRFLMWMGLIGMGLNLQGAGMQINLQALDGDLKGDKNLRPCSWLKEKSNTMLVGNVSGAMDEWQHASFSFTPEKTGHVRLILKGPYDSKRTPDQYQWVLYDDIRVNRKPLVNGGFEEGFNNWAKSSWGKVKQLPQIVDDPMLVKSGRKSVRVWHNGSVIATIPVTAKQAITIDLFFRPTDDYSLKSGDTTLSLAKVANRGFADEKSGDGKGGWSDQGPKQDFRGFDVTRRRFYGMSFDIVDPVVGNNGLSIVTFDSPRDQTGVKEITFDVPAGQHGTFFYLLHSACWTCRKGEIGRIEFIDAAGKSKTLPVELGKDIRDWYGAVDLPNAKVACHEPSAPKLNKGIYFSKFPVPSMDLRTIRLTGNGVSPWIICGATLSSRDIVLNRIFTPPSDFIPGDLASNTYIQPGSALDIRSVGELVPAGKYGRIRFAANGILEFENRPGVPLRFKSAYQFPQNWRQIKRVLALPKELAHKEIDGYVAELRRRGYNMVRVWTEQILVLYADADSQPRMDGLDLLDYFFSKLKENGIYVNLGVAAYSQLYKWRKTGNPPELKTKMFLGDATVRKMWTDMARLLLCHVNPYTGLAMKDDPMLVCVEPYNELAFGFCYMRQRGKEAARLASEKFKAFLIKKYGKIDSPIPPYPDETTGTYQKDWYEFCYNHVKETTQWFRRQLKELGCKAPMAQYNMTTQRYYGDIRYQYDDIVIKNAYFMHPTQYMKIGSKCRQGSAIQAAGDYFRRSIAARFADRPMIQTEYNHSFWNQYEYEQPLFPVYAAYQGYAGLTMHEVNMLEQQEPARDFSSPIDTVSDYLTSFFFVRGDITPSKHLTLLSIQKSSLFADGAGYGINMEQLKCAFLTRFGVKYEDTPRPERIEKLPPPQAEMTIPLEGFSEVKFSKMFSEEGGVKKSAFSLKNYVDALKRKGILPASNRSNPEKGIFESDTGEIFMDVNNKVMTVKTPYSEMIVSENITAQSLPCMKSVRSSVPSTTAIVSLDPREPVKSSKRMLLFYMTAVMNTGMEFSGDRVVLKKVGTLPVLIRTGQLDLKLELDRTRRYTLYPLRSDGLRRAAVPIIQNNGRLEITLDTATLGNGPTMMFELVAKD